MLPDFGVIPHIQNRDKNRERCRDPNIIHGKVSGEVITVPVWAHGGLIVQLITLLGQVPFIPQRTADFIIYHEISIFLTVLPCHPVRMGNTVFPEHFIYGPHYANGLYVTQRDRCNVRHDE